MINRVKFQLMYYDYTSYPPDYTFRLPKLHLCIWGVNRSGYVSNTILGERERKIVVGREKLLENLSSESSAKLTKQGKQSL